MSRARLLPADAEGIAEAAAIVRAGGLVAFPTETVYGLGALATDAGAVARAFAAKARPADNPLIVHVASLAELRGIAAPLGPLASTLAARWWPGPLTLVVAAHPALPRVVTGGLDTVAVRIPAHAAAAALLAAVGAGVAAPSANRSGRPSPTTSAHVLADLGADIDAVIDGGATAVGVESTVVDARGSAPIVLRDGAVTRAQLGLDDADIDHDAEVQRSPGSRHRHYAPACTVRGAEPGAVAAVVAAAVATGARVGVIATAPVAAPAVTVALFRDAEDLARRLYAALRDAEAAGVDLVVVETVPETGVGRAVMDRIRRASA